MSVYSRMIVQPVKIPFLKQMCLILKYDIHAKNNPVLTCLETPALKYL